ncbi:MAG: DUF167 domain-containing protein [Desulfosoma sp.]
MSRRSPERSSEPNTDGSRAFIRNHPEGATISIVVQPNARKTEVGGLQDGAVKIKVCAPPVEGAANRECLRFLASLTATAKNRVVLLQGEKSRTKVVLIKGTSAEELANLFRAFGLSEERHSPTSNGS